jgi:hypothetical protein
MQYEIVPGSTKSVMITCVEDDHDDDDTRRTRSRSNTRKTRSSTRDREEIIPLEKQEQFVIQRDDVIAVCLPDNIRERYRLQILEDMTSKIEGVYKYIVNKEVRVTVRNCNFDGLQTIIGSRMLRARSRYQLNLFAEIAGK